MKSMRNQFLLLKRCVYQMKTMNTFSRLRMVGTNPAFMFHRGLWKDSLLIALKSFVQDSADCLKEIINIGKIIPIC